MDNSYILYEGDSRLENVLITVVATGFKQKSKNTKTGNTIQTFILVDRMKPVDAWHEGADYAVCGDCVHRGVKTGKRSCYVNLGHAPTQVWKAYKRGKYQPIIHNAELFSGRTVRIGSYGDPVAVPIEIWENIISHTNNVLAYTHLWRLPEAQDYKSFCMASCDTETDRLIAKELGWRTFRIVPNGTEPSEKLMHNEMVCTNTTHNIQCNQCKLCNGNIYKSAKDIVIEAHGCGAKQFIKNIQEVNK